VSDEDTRAMSAEEVAALLDDREGEPDGEASPPMHRTEGNSGQMPEPGDFEDDQEPEDRSPRPGNAPAPGQRPSESGSNPPDIESVES
jgi:hypothetical protein